MRPSLNTLFKVAIHLPTPGLQSLMPCSISDFGHNIYHLLTYYIYYVVVYVYCIYSLQQKFYEGRNVYYVHCIYSLEILRGQECLGFVCCLIPNT